MSFADRLKQLREAAGLSQPELAERAGMNRFGVAKLEQGVREPSWATVRALAKALGVNCTAFETSEEQVRQGTSPEPSPPKARARPAPATPAPPPADELQATARRKRERKGQRRK